MLAALLAARGKLDEELPHFLGIFEQVCQTMSYAHSRGVIHRDLKPGNIMVGCFGEVQLMDWGLAKVLRTVRGAERPIEGRAPDDRHASPDDGSSHFGSVIGTPAYMAPEQARGETGWLDERVDVFGLGAILCEILTGQPPYVGRSAGEVHELAAGADLTGAWRRLDACGADPELVAITRRCLSPLPRDRPRDASETVVLVSGYLCGVQERLKRAEVARVEAVAKAVEEQTRRRLAVGLATTVVLLMATLAGAGSLAVWNHQRRSAEFDRALRDVAVRKAEAETSGDDPARWATARESARRIEQMLDDAPDLSSRSQVADLVADLKARADAVATDRKLLEELAEIRDVIADAPFEQSDHAYATAFRVAGIDILERSPDEIARKLAPRPARVAVAIITAIDRWAALRRGHGDQDGAARLTAIAQAADSDAWRTQLRLALAEPDRNLRLATLRELANSVAQDGLPPIALAVLGEALLRAGDAKTAEAVLRPAQRQYPRDLELSLAVAQALEELSRRPEAIRYYMMARAIRPQSGHSLAHALMSEQESDEAIAVFRDLIRLSPSVARHYACLGNALRSQGRVREANEVLDSGIAAGRETATKRPDDPFAHFVLGTALSRRGQLDDAIGEFAEAIRLRPDFAAAHRNLGIARLNQQRFADAVAALRAAIRLEPHDHQAHAVLAHTLEALGRRDDAISELKETIRLKPDEAAAHYNLGQALFHRGRLDDALAAYRAAIRLKLGVAVVHYNVGHILQLKGQVSEAIEEYREAIRIKPDFAEAHCNLADQLKAQGRYEEALVEYERGHELGSKRADWTYPSAKWVEDARRVARLKKSQQSEN
jgi:serine/threonine-protein kinase